MTRQDAITLAVRRSLRAVASRGVWGENVIVFAWMTGGALIPLDAIRAHYRVVCRTYGVRA
jgi:hypothetical protein